MLKEEKEFQHSKIKILSLKNQASFDKANKIGIKNHSKSMILITCPHLHSFEAIDSKDKPDNNLNTINHPIKEITIYLGLKISKKLGNAVIRNKIRRRIKSIIYNLHSNLDHNLLYNRVIVIIPKKGIESLNYQSFHDEIVTNILSLSSKAPKISITTK